MRLAANLSRGQEAHGLNMLKIQGEPGALRGRADHVPLQGERQFQQRIDTQGAALGVVDGEQGVVCLEGPELFFSLRNLRMLGQHANDGRVEVALKQGNQLMAHAIARVLELPIAGIFPPGLADGLQVSGDLTPRDGQQGTNDAAYALLRLPNAGMEYADIPQPRVNAAQPAG